jgi:hypothetical protein
MDTLRYWNTKYDHIADPWRTLIVVVPLFLGLALGIILSVWIAVIVFVLLLGFRLPIVLHPTIPAESKPDDTDGSPP